MSFDSVIVVGGGLAGLSSATALAEAGCRVRLFEKRPHLGGRAASYSLPDGTEIDNCQHVTMGCCTNLADFYGRVGAREKIRFFDHLAFADREGRLSRIAPSWLPAPLHLAPSFALFRSLGVADKLGIARALQEIIRKGGRPAGARAITMLEWLTRRRQTPAAIDRFWRLVLVSALDEGLDRAEAQYGIDVFWKAFLSNRTGFRIGVPTVPLGDLYAGCAEALARRGGEIRTRARASRFRIEDGRVAALVFDDGSEQTADAYLAAVPPAALLEMLPAGLADREPVFAGLRNLHASPITGVHLWYDRPVTSEPFLALVGLESQWIFNKTLLLGDRLSAADRAPAGAAGSPAGAGQYLQVVISASYDLVPRSRQEIIDLVRREVELVLPAARAATLAKATVVKETAATFSPEPGVDLLRPEARSPIRQLFLAGDWTRTGWPATMESAVRSGYLAAQAILSLAGQHRTFLQPDLPPEGLVHILARSQAEE
jgi:squalene-associated FAD-dependent desaturase